MPLTFEDKLANYADLLVKVGVNLQPGGKLHVNAPIEAAPLARLIAERAYDAGAVAVDVRYEDQRLSRVFFERANEAALDYYPAWATEETQHKLDEGYAFLSIAGSDPDLLAGLDQGRIAARARLTAQRGAAIAAQMGAFRVNWSVGAMPVPSWARKVFPELPLEEAISRLWDAIFQVTRADLPDPLAAWREHTAQLARVRDHLNGRGYAALRFQGPGTDLKVGLADGHRWVGGATAAQNGVVGVPNLPTDEVFTAPHRQRVEGFVSASKPLSVRGELIEGLWMRFEAGRVVEASATRGQAVLERLLDTDEGARHLGEVALVPASSPVARTGLLFYNTLFDENAASHLALGRAYPLNVAGEMGEAGANDSLIHVDWMIGSEQMNVEGIGPDGSHEAVMRAGEWAL